jgi:hypothetical protein
VASTSLLPWTRTISEVGLTLSGEAERGRLAGTLSRLGTSGSQTGPVESSAFIAGRASWRDRPSPLVCAERAPRVSSPKRGSSPHRDDITAYSDIAGCRALPQGSKTPAMHRQHPCASLGSRFPATARPAPMTALRLKHPRRSCDRSAPKAVTCEAVRSWLLLRRSDRPMVARGYACNSSTPAQQASTAGSPGRCRSWRSRRALCRSSSPARARSTLPGTTASTRPLARSPLHPAPPVGEMRVGGADLRRTS